MYRLRNVEEERTRTLYVRLPHTIRNPKEVQELFEDDAKVKLPRQSSRACHVIFPSVEKKIEGLKNVAKKTINGKRVIAFNPKPKPMENRITSKKIVVPIPKPQPKITRSLFVSNISNKTTVDDLKNAFPGCISVAMLVLNSQGRRSAFVKMKSFQIAGEYLRKDRKWPVVRGHSLFVRANTRKSKPRRGSKSNKIKIYDEDGKTIHNKFENLNNKKKNEHNTEHNDESDSEPEIDSETD